MEEGEGSIAAAAEDGASAAAEDAPPPLAFANRAPSDREAREAARDKTALEKARLAARRGGHYRYDGSDNPLALDENAPGYLPDSERFVRDVAGEQRAQRLQGVVKRETNWDTKRETLYAREEGRWDKMEEEYAKEGARLDKLRERPCATRNKASVAYDITSLKYHESDAGRSLNYRDDMIKYRANLRANQIYAHSHGEGFDIITGAPIPQERRAVGPKPVKPDA